MNFLQTVSLRTAHRMLESWKRILNPLQRPVEHFPVEEPQPVNRDVDGTGRVIILPVIKFAVFGSGAYLLVV